MYFFHNFNFVLYLLRLLNEKLKKLFFFGTKQEYIRLSFDTYFFDACSLIRPTLGPKVAVTLRDLRRLKENLLKMLFDLRRFKATLGHIRGPMR